MAPGAARTTLALAVPVALLLALALAQGRPDPAGTGRRELGELEARTGAFVPPSQDEGIFETVPLTDALLTTATPMVPQSLVVGAGEEIASVATRFHQYSRSGADSMPMPMPMDP